MVERPHRTRQSTVDITDSKDGRARLVNQRQSRNICNTQPRRYTCPKCEIPYCSLECYKSEEHFECTENFYKDWVETELKTQNHDPEAKRTMIDILKRINAPDLEFQHDSIDENDTSSLDPLNLIDSDDDEDIPDLADRLQSVNLNNADELWAALTDTEKQEFEAILRNGEATKFIPPWKPWWSDTSAKELIREVRDDEAKSDFAARCPSIIEVSTFNDIAKASPFVRFNLLNVLHAYAYMALYCNGDHQDSPRESVTVFLRLSANMRSNKVFQDPQRAIESISRSAIDCQSLPGDEEAIAAAKEAVNLITNGAEDSSSNFYISAALSDLHRLFTNAKNETIRFHGTDRSFSTRFCIGETETKLSMKTLLLCTKKIEYYLSWVKSHETRLFPKIFN